MSRPAGFFLDVTAALDGAGRLLAPARWSVARGRTLSLERAPRGADVLPLLLLPGLVDAHSHLDLADAGPLPAQGSFPEWLLAVGGARAAASDVVEAARREAAALGARGVTALGDIDATGGQGTEGRLRAGVGGRSFLEIVGVPAAAARSRLAATLALVDRGGAGATAFGLSPHAPYSVNAAVVPEIVRAGQRRGLPLAMHLAESREETRYLLHGDGPFAEFLQVIGKGRPFERPPGCRPVAWAAATGFLDAGGVVVHGADLDDGDVDVLAEHRATVVYCHGTHRHFERPAHRWLDLERAGVTLAVGTDSGASNDGVDLFGELVRLVADRPDVPPLSVLRAATAGGRRALALDGAAALFGRGAPADAVLLGPLPDAPSRGAGDVLAAWAFSGEAEVLATLHAGRCQRPADVVSRPLAARLDTLLAPG